MAELWSRGGLTWKELFRRTLSESWKDEVFGQAARLAFYFFLALVPSLILFSLFLAKLAHTGLELRGVLSETLGQILPAQSSPIVSPAVQQTGAILGTSGLALSIAAAVWAALNGMWALITGLNAAYEVEEGRPTWKAFLVSAWLMAVWGVLALIALAAILLGARIGGITSGSLWHLLWPVIHWAIAVAALLVGFAIVYRFGPHLEGQRTRWATPGAVIGVILWIASAVGFRVYLEHFNSYNRLYGPLGSVAILMLWLYISGAAILIGGEVNGVIEHAAAARGDLHFRAPGERRPGEHRRPRRPAA